MTVIVPPAVSFAGSPQLHPCAWDLGQSGIGWIVMYRSSQIIRFGSYHQRVK